VALVGPTAAGKSDIAMAVARRCGASILSVDSMQVYRDMDIGTAKPSPEEQSAVRHHMIDVADPADHYSVAEFRRRARAALTHEDSEVVLIAGGSGLHFRSVVDPMSFRPTDEGVRRELEGIEMGALVAELLAADSLAGNHVDLSNPRRVRRSVESLRLGGPKPSEWAADIGQKRYRNYDSELDFVGFGIDRSDIAPAVAGRLAEMRRRGFLAEVERLAPRLGRTAAQAVGYRQLLEVVEGSLDVEAGFQEAERATMALVKRQRTFFRRDPRLRWLDTDADDLADVVLREAGL
jgi:tRNA dimethylallyltransferase